MGAQPETHAAKVKAVVDLANKLGLAGILVAVERQESGDDTIGVVRLRELRALEQDKALEFAHALSQQTTAAGARIQQAAPPPAEADA